MRTAPVLLSPHRRARYIALARLAVLWAAAALFGALKPNRRHIKQRYGWLSLDGLVRTICLLAVIRAAELAHRTRNPNRSRIAPPPGFRRAMPASMRRAMIGAHLRHWFNHKDVRVRIARALEALSDLDAFVHKHVLKRAQRRLTRLRPLIAVRPPAQAFVSAPALAPTAADTS